MCICISKYVVHYKYIQVYLSLKNSNEGQGYSSATQYLYGKHEIMSSICSSTKKS